MDEVFEAYYVVNVAGQTRVVSFDEEGRIVIQRKSDFDLYHKPLGERVRTGSSGSRHSATPDWSARR